MGKSCFHFTKDITAPGGAIDNRPLTIELYGPQEHIMTIDYFEANAVNNDKNIKRQEKFKKQQDKANKK